MFSPRATCGSNSVSSMAYQAPLPPRACSNAWAHQQRQIDDRPRTHERLSERNGLDEGRRGIVGRGERGAGWQRWLDVSSPRQSCRFGGQLLGMIPRGARPSDGDGGRRSSDRCPAAPGGSDHAGTPRWPGRSGDGSGSRSVGGQDRERRPRWGAVPCCAARPAARNSAVPACRDVLARAKSPWSAQLQQAAPHA